jgi:hypothetical protein
MRGVRGGCVAVGAVLLAACATTSGTQQPADIRVEGSRVHPESITADADGNIYVGSIAGTLYRALAGSTAAEPWIVPGPANGLTSLFGVLADDARGLLWVCNNPPFGGPPQPGARSGAKTFNLESGELEGNYDFPEGPAACNDIAIAADGTTYVTDTSGGRIFALAPGAVTLALFAEGADLVGIDGIALAADGTMYINNVRQHTVQRVNRAADGTYAGLTTLALSEPVNGPDALRPVGGNRFLQAEGPGNRVTYVDIEGDRAVITPVRTGLDSSPGVTHHEGIGYATEGKIGYLFDPALRDQNPDPFIIRAFRLP